MAIKRLRGTRRVQPIMATPTGRSSRTRRKRVFRTRRKIGWSWLGHLPLLWMAAVAGCLFLLYFVVGSNYFSVRTVNASNLSGRDLQAVIARCQCVGDNIFTLREDVIRRRLEGIPSLIVERVYTRLPNQIVVVAQYKQRVAIWRTPDVAYAVAADGEVLQVWRRPFPKHTWDGMAIFDEGFDSTIKKGKRLVVGDHVERDALTMGLSLRAHFPVALRPQVKRYYYRPFIGFTVESKTGWWALFGLDSSSLLDARITSLQGMLSGNPPVIGPGDCVDLRDPNLKNLYMRQDHRCGM